MKANLLFPAIISFKYQICKFTADIPNIKVFKHMESDKINLFREVHTLRNYASRTIYAAG